MNPLVMSIIEDIYIDEEEKLEIEHLSEFKEESLEILEQLEEKLVTLEHTELNDEIVKEVYRSFHSIKGIAGFASQTLIETIAHNTETILSKLQNGLIEFDLVVVEILINSVQLIKQLCKDFSLVKDKKFNEIVKIHLNNLKNFKIKEHKRLEILDDLVLENEEYIKVPLRKIEDLYFRIETIRRLSDKLDEYNYVQYKEELNIVLEKIENYISRYKAQEIETLFKKLHKVAKYNMKTTGINCEIICKGGEIVIDKKILNRLFVPMVQIVRNALTHGFTNKIEEKKIFINAIFENTELIINVENNGEEINKEKIKRKIIEKNIDFQDENILNAIFLSGFSTKKDEDIISGRGIGLDIVKSEIEKMQGTISVHSEVGKGTLFRIAIPTKNNNILKDMTWEVMNE